MSNPNRGRNSPVLKIHIMKHLIRNVHEVRVGLLLTKYVDKYITLFRKPLQSLKNTKKCFDSLIVFQSPYQHSSKTYRYSDFTVWDKSKNVNIRGEVRYSSVANSDLNCKVLSIIHELPNYPENELVLILLGEGFNEETDIMYQIKTELKNNPNVIVCNTLNEFDNYLISKFN